MSDVTGTLIAQRDEALDALAELLRNMDAWRWNYATNDSTWRAMEAARAVLKTYPRYENALLGKQE